MAVAPVASAAPTDAGLNRQSARPVGSRDALLHIAAVFLAGLYLVQTATPLRLDTDSVRYFDIALGLREGVIRTATSAPLGYPVILATLDRVGLGSTHWIILMNCLFLALGLGAVWYMARDRAPSVRAWMIVITLLCIPVIRAVAMPQPEAPFFGISLIALATMSAVTPALSARNAGLLLLALLLTAVAITIRLAGLALLAPLAWSVIRMIRSTSGRIPLRGRRAIVTSGVVGALILFAMVAVSGTEHGTLYRYFDESQRVAGRSVFGFLVRRLEFTFRGFGELTLNLPYRRLANYKVYLPVLGLAVGTLLLYLGKYMRWNGVIAAYVVTYVAMLALWPHYDTRLWMPILPLIVLLVVTALHAVEPGRQARWLIGAYVGWLVLTSSAAFYFTTRITLAGENFRERYGRNGGFAARTHRDSMHDARARAIIKRFDATNPAWRGLELEERRLENPR